MKSTQTHIAEHISINDVSSDMSWKELDRKCIIMHFRQSLSFERIDLYLQQCNDLKYNEKVILFWLSKIYTNSLNTIELYARYAVQFFNYARKDFHVITNIEVDAFIKKIQLEGAKPATIDTVSAILKSFFKTMSDARFIERNPAAFLEKSKKQRAQTLAGYLQHSFSHEEMEILLEYMRDHAPLRDYVLMMFLYTTGLRVLEVCSLKWEHIILWQDQWYADVLGKGTKARRVYIPEKTLEMLMDYRQSTFNVIPFAPPKHIASMPVFPRLRNKHVHISRHGIYKIVKKWICKALEKVASQH